MTADPDPHAGATIFDPHGNAWQIPHRILDVLGVRPGQKLTKAQMDDLLHEIMSDFDLTFSINPRQPQ